MNDHSGVPYNARLALATAKITCYENKVLGAAEQELKNSPLPERMAVRAHLTEILSAYRTEVCAQFEVLALDTLKPQTNL